MKQGLRSALLGGAALMAVVAGLPEQATAQVQSPGFFGSVAGWYYLDSGNDQFTFKNNFPTGSPGDGWGGRVYGGYRFSNPYDVAIGAEGSWLSRGKTVFFKGGSDWSHQKADYWLADLEVGYNTAFNSVGARFFIGARYAEFDHRTYPTDSGNDPPATPVKTDYHGIGPRIGFDFAARLAPNSAFSVFGGASGSVLFGRMKVTGGPIDTITTSETQAEANDRKSRTVWNATGQLGVGYEIAPMVNLAAGYRVDYWNGVGPTDMNPGPGNTAGYQITGKADRLMHGPFVRVSYNIGAPRPAPVAAVAPAPAAVMTKNFIVFFDFDRSNLTAQAQNTIREAAAASKTGGVQRINVTGHADKSGGDAYNMALSLRRANTVRDDLVRNGVPANAIVVVARGESQPLVPTADGVREPQNRRVEIVLN